MEPPAAAADDTSRPFPTFAGSVVGAIGVTQTASPDGKAFRVCADHGALAFRSPVAFWTLAATRYTARAAPVRSALPPAEQES
jgi:hypothetical protein